MVTKRKNWIIVTKISSVLAKILMVTKRPARYKYHTQGSVLAKIFMVTKQCTNLLIVSFKFCSSKNPYGNKTDEVNANNQQVFCSSKNLYGNKTYWME